MATKPKFAEAKKPAGLSAEQTSFIEKGAGKDTDRNADEATFKMSVDVPEALHTRFKVACAIHRQKMGPEIVAFIKRRVAELEAPQNN